MNRMYELLLVYLSCVLVAAYGYSGDLEEANKGVKVIREGQNKIRKVKAAPCLIDYHCGKKESCNLYTRFCDKCTARGKICRRNENCCGELLCIFGQCNSPLKTDGSYESVCKTHKDCLPGLCCAKDHGLLICKSYQRVGYRCSFPIGGLEYSVRHECPCLPGLKCTHMSKDPTDMRCVRDQPFPFGKK